MCRGSTGSPRGAPAAAAPLPVLVTRRRGLRRVGVDRPLRRRPPAEPEQRLFTGDPEVEALARELDGGARPRRPAPDLRAHAPAPGADALVQQPGRPALGGAGADARSTRSRSAGPRRELPIVNPDEDAARVLGDLRRDRRAPGRTPISLRRPLHGRRPDLRRARRRGRRPAAVRRRAPAAAEQLPPSRARRHRGLPRAPRGGLRLWSSSRATGGTGCGRRSARAPRPGCAAASSSPPAARRPTRGARPGSARTAARPTS